MKMYTVTLRLPENILNEIAQLATDGARAYNADIGLQEVMISAISKGLGSVKAEIAAKLDPPKRRLRVVR